MTSANLFLAPLLCAAALAQTPTADPGGWSKAKWGMTKKQVLAAFGDEAKSPPPRLDGKRFGSEPGVTVPGLDIAGVTFTAELTFEEETTRLDRIVLHSLDKKPSDTLFDSLERLLTQRYGQPVRRDIRSVSKLILSAMWVFPKTVIELEMIEAENVNVRSVTVLYFENKRSVVDKL